MNSTSQAESPLIESDIISPLWRRALAFIIDFTVLGALGMALGFLFFDFFSKLGIWGRGIGFAVTLVYFGILDSRVGGGQTLGKRLLRIKVVNEQFVYLGIFASFLRCTVFWLPYFFNGVLLGQSLVLHLLSFLVVYGLGFSIFYLFLFNRRTNQSLHDLAVGAFVVNVNANPPLVVPRVWKWHFLIVACVLALSLLLSIKGFLQRDLSALADLENVRRNIAEFSDVKTAGINLGSIWKSSDGGTTVHFINASVWVKKDIIDKERLAFEIIKTIFAKSPSALQMHSLTVNVFYGFDIGIAHASRQQRYTYSPQQWTEIIENKELKAGPSESR